MDVVDYQCRETPPLPGDLVQERPVPPVVYLPSAGASTSWGTEVEMRYADDGQLALLAYTALDRLVDCMGPHQPWVLVHTERLPEMEQQQPYDVICLDMPLPREMWKQAPVTEERSTSWARERK